MGIKPTLADGLQTLNDAKIAEIYGNSQKPCIFPVIEIVLSVRGGNFPKLSQTHLNT